MKHSNGSGITLASTTERLTDREHLADVLEHLARDLRAGRGDDEVVYELAQVIDPADLPQHLMAEINAVDGVLLDVDDRHDVIEFLRTYEQWKATECRIGDYVSAEELREVAPLIFVAERTSVLSRADPPV